MSGTCVVAMLAAESHWMRLPGDSQPCQVAASPPIAPWPHKPTRAPPHPAPPTCRHRLHSRWPCPSCTWRSRSSRRGKGASPPGSHTQQASAVRRCRSCSRRLESRPPRRHLRACNRVGGGVGWGGPVGWAAQAGASPLSSPLVPAAHAAKPGPACQPGSQLRTLNPNPNPPVRPHLATRPLRAACHTLGVLQVEVPVWQLRAPGNDDDLAGEQQDRKEEAWCEGQRLLKQKSESGSSGRQGTMMTRQK